MTHTNLHILVLLREISDPRPPARVTTRGAGISDRGLRLLPNPADLAALEEALLIRESHGATVTALTIGPSRLDDTLRLALSMGADRGIRFWNHGLEGGDAVADARVLARLVTILSPSLVFTGNRLADRGDDPVPALAAATAGTSCIFSALELTLKSAGVEVLRKADRGGSQTVSAPFPCTILFEETRAPRYPSVEAITNALFAKVEEWELADLGLPFWSVGSSGAYLAGSEFGTPRPDPVRVVTPDAQLPAFERILSLLSGGIKPREGRMHFLAAEEAAGDLWRIMGEEGLITKPA